MIYFVNEYFMAWNSGIEHSEMQRLRMFHNANIPVQIVTRDYNQLTEQYRQNFKLPEHAILNMFDYFQDATDVPATSLKINDLKLGTDYSYTPGTDVSEIYEGDHLVMKVHYAPATYGQVYTVEYYNRREQKINADLYDIRGFKSREQFFDQQGHLTTQVSFSPNGERKIEEFFSRNAAGQFNVTLIHLLDYQGRERYFNSYNELFTFFLDELSRVNSDAVFVADRAGDAYQAVLDMQTNAKRFATIPTTHTIAADDQIFANLSGAYVPILVNQPERLSGVITATKQQRLDLVRWLGGASNLPVPIHTAPFGNVTKAQLAQPIDSEQKFHQQKVVFVGQVANNQRIDFLLLVFKAVAEKVSGVTFDIYGYGPATSDIEQQIATAGLTDRVQLRGYQVVLDDVYDQATVFISATENDAQSLAILEALSHGTPVVANAENYSPVDLVDETDGKLIRNEDLDQFIKATTKLLTNQKAWQKASNGALKKAAEYQEDLALDTWQKVLKI